MKPRLNRVLAVGLTLLLGGCVATPASRRRRNRCRISGEPDTEAPLQTLRLLRTLLPLESQGYTAELVQQRRRLQQISPMFFRVYLEVVVEGRRNS